MFEKEKKVSIIVPCYNGEQFVDRCLSSILIQDYSNVECIVVDDGSTDSSKEKILNFEENFREKNWKLKYVYQKNKGLGGAINTGLKLVTGDYLILLDIDDEYLPGALKEKADFLSENEDVYVVRSNGWMLNGKNKFLFIYEDEEKQIEDLFMALLCGRTNNWAGSYMVRTDKLFDFYPDREIYTSRYGQNLQLILPLVYKRKCGYIDKPQMNYIRQENSLSNTSDKNNEKAKSIENTNGYTEIRKYMTKLVIKDAEEQKYMLKEIDKAYYRSIMSIAIMHKDRTLLKESYLALKKLGNLLLNDRIVCFDVIHPILAFCLKGYRKISRFFRRTQ